MGTRAAFFVGDPRDVEGREWLGCVDWDGYPDGVGLVPMATHEAEYRAAVAKLREERADFTDPGGDRFPFPWQDDLFLTDCVYAFFEGKTQLSEGGCAFRDPAALLSDDEDDQQKEDPTCDGVPAPGSKPWSLEHDRSIMVISRR
jgi:hypothetical protein